MVAVVLHKDKSKLREFSNLSILTCLHCLLMGNSFKHQTYNTSYPGRVRNPSSQFLRLQIVKPIRLKWLLLCNSRNASKYSSYVFTNFLVQFFIKKKKKKSFQIIIVMWIFFSGRQQHLLFKQVLKSVASLIQGKWCQNDSFI